MFWVEPLANWMPIDDAYEVRLSKPSIIVMPSMGQMKPSGLTAWRPYVLVTTYCIAPLLDSSAAP